MSEHHSVLRCCLVCINRLRVIVNMGEENSMSLILLYFILLPPKLYVTMHGKILLCLRYEDISDMM